MGTKSPTVDSANQEGQLLQQAVDFVIRKCGDAGGGQRPATGIILGSGLGGLADQIHDPVVFSYGDIPGFGVSSAGGHRGELILGAIEASPVIAMAGRFHRYEGWSNEQVAFPVKLMARLGADRLIVSNAAGGVNPKFRVGDIVVIRDHLNFMGCCDFRGSGGLQTSDSKADQKSSQLRIAPERQTKFDAECPGLMRGGEIYDSELSRIAFQVGRRDRFNVYPGTYLATLGPNYETRSEYRMMRRIGADVAGMSTVPEVLAGSAAGMRILGLSMVSNVANPDQPTKADHSEVLEAGISAAVKLEGIVREVLSS